MLSLHTNAASLSTQNSLASTNKALGSSMTKLGTGFRVNSAMDDAAGLQIATRLNAQSRGMQVAQKNTQNGISMLQTAEGAMNEVGNMLLRMKDLATESANGTTSQDDRDALQSEYDALGKEIGNILSNTTFGGDHLFSKNGSIKNTAGDAIEAGGKLGATTGTTFQVGATAAETIKIDAGKASTGSMTQLFEALGKVTSQFIPVDPGTAPAATAGTKPTGYVAGSGVAADTAWDVATAADAKALAAHTAKAADFAAGIAPAGSEISAANSSAIIDTINTAINAVGTFRSEVGAVANRLEHTFNNLGNMIQNTEAAKGRIMDVDYATETSNMTSKQMLMQASTSMLKQSNSMSQMVASLLQ